MSGAKKKVVIIAGPNGAGKTTFAREYLPHEAACPHFINADLIAAGLSPFAPEHAAVRAGRVMLDEMTRAAAEGRSFAIETSLSGLRYVERFADWHRRGYTLHLIYLKLSSVEEALARVAMRVRQGGHDVPPDVLRRRFVRGWPHFDDIYRHRVNCWKCFDNSGPTPVFLNGGTSMSRPPASQLPDADLQGVDAALLRAAHRAREIARQTGTAVVVVRDGVIVEERVDDSAATAASAISRP